MNCDERGDLITIGASALGEAVMRLVASLGACIGLRYGVSADAEYVVEQIVERDEEGGAGRGVRLPKRGGMQVKQTNFDGKVALITGGTTGIGEAAVRLVASLGARVVFVGRDRRRGEWLERELLLRRSEAVFLQADLRVTKRARMVVPFTIRRFGRLDFALNNAGISGESGLLAEQSEENFDDVFAVNVKGLFLTMQAELEQMAMQGEGGSIVNVASVGGMLATPGAAPYIASKHAVIGLTKSAAVEYGRHGIRVNAISPGSIRTEMLRGVFGSDGALERVAMAHPLGRIGEPEEVAEAVAWLFSESSSYYTGQSLTLDGGLTAQRPSVRPGVMPAEVVRVEEEVAATIEG